MEHKLYQQNDISLAPEKIRRTADTLENSSTDQHSAIKPKMLNAIDKIRKNKKKTEAPNIDQDFIEMMISELSKRNQIENRRTPQGLVSFRRSLSLSLEQEEVLCSPVHEKCNYISPQFMEIDCVSNETIPEVATDLRPPEIKEKRQIEKYSSEGTQTDFPEICHSSSFANIEEILSKVLRVDTDLSALKNHVKCKFSDMNRKMG